MYYLYIYVPESHKEGLKNALFDIGFGRFNHYDCCSWEIKGKGQFRALEESTPFLGEKNKIYQEDEYRIEMISQDKKPLQKLKETLKKAHPYECPAYGVIKLENDLF